MLTRKGLPGVSGNSLRQVKKLMLTAGALGALAIAASALGAHGLKATFEATPAKRPAYANAADQHLLHAVAVLLLAVTSGLRTEAAFARQCLQAGWTMVTGLLLFSGSLYLWVFGGPKWLVHVTPVGGLMLIAAWLLVIRAAMRLTARQEAGI